MRTLLASPHGRRIALVVGWLLVALQLANLARHAYTHADTSIGPGWDLAVYRGAAETVAEGRSPYGKHAIVGYLPYTYSPLLRPILPAFSGDAGTVHLVYTGLALASLIAAALVLIRGLRLGGLRAAAAGWLVVGGGACGMNLDFQAGNITGFEMLPATIVLVGVWRRRPVAIALGMALLCLAKPTWLLLALLPLVLDLEREGLKRAAVAGVAGLVPLAAALALAPGETRAWLGEASKLRESFNVNPCLRELFRDGFAVLRLPASDLIWAPIALGIVVLLFRLRRSCPAALAPGAIAAFALFAPLFFPRFKSYSYTIPGMLIAVLLTLDRRALRELALPILLVSFPYLATYDQDSIRLFERMNARHLPLGGWPMVLTTVAGILVVRWTLRERDRAPESRDLLPGAS